jgi:predicted MFS family arabinose efflux permease
MLALAKNRNYTLLWFAQLISMIGDWALFAALPFFIFKLTGSVLATGAMFMIQILPPLVFGSIAGVFVDRWDHRWTMIGSSLFRGVVLLLLLGVRSADMVWLVYLTGFLESTASQFFNPANNALLPRLVGEDQLLSANSLDSLGENSARLIGPALGGILLAVIGLQGVVLIDISSYLLAALLMFFMRVNTSDTYLTDIAGDNTGGSISDIWGELIAGIRLVLSTRPLSRIFLIIGIAFLGDSILTVLFVAFIQDVVGVGSAEFGISLTVRGLAGILGGVIIGAVGSKFRPSHLISFGLIGTGIGLGAMVFWPIYTVTLLILVLLSVPLMSWLLSVRTWIQSHAPDDYRGRIFGVLETFNATLMLVGMGFASGLGEIIGISTTLYFSSAIYVLSGVLAAVLLQMVGKTTEKSHI